eukprot:TRINITY_DN13116_c0_g2_i1.p1 TRINITY_DN13116_c0_g2~~TRINITY_DN13116_c0_g2_i1.p1  ORF type:complete len:215 (-),score=43.86 TRINITY_DN13116_c0_g2_i1:239-883(-)
MRGNLFRLICYRNKNYNFCANMSSFKIYTKTGDQGESSLFNGERKIKSDQCFEALGNVDELNSSIGVAREYCVKDSLQETVEQLERIQCRLLDVGSAVATPLNNSSESKLAKMAFDKSGNEVNMLENWIDVMDQSLPALKNFILPSGGLAASHLHMARTICRRAERSVVCLYEKGQVDKDVLVYLNRLSDYLFTVARFAAMKAGNTEVIYKKST